jgi:hypothetical protein
MRTIESPGVEIREKDISLNTEVPVGTTVYAVGYADQGPTDELINLTSITEFEQIYGTPTNAAERYFFETCKQTLQANGNLLATRLPYGSGGGEGFASNYSALVFPAFPFDNNAQSSKYGGLSAYSLTSSVSTDAYGQSFSGVIDIYATSVAAGSADYIGFDTASTVISLSSTAAAVNFVPQTGSNTLSSTNPDWTGTWTVVDEDLDKYRWTISTTSASANDDDITFTTQASSIDSATTSKFSDSDNFYLGQPAHTVVDEGTYLNWLQGGITWYDGEMSGFTTAQYADLSAVGYGGMVVVNEIKSSIDDNFAGYYVAVADNSKIDKGSNFDSVTNVKSLNSNTGSADWVTLNTDRLNFALSGTYTQGGGSISEIIETTPGWEFGDTGAGGYSDSVILTQFKLRPTIYNASEKTLDRVVNETYVGSFDSNRKINDPNGGPVLNFYLENIINDSSNSMRVFINPNISTNSGLWSDAQTGLPTKKVRIASAEKSNTNELGTALAENPTNPAEPHGKAAVVHNLTSASNYLVNADSLYGSGEYVESCVASVKNIGLLPSKLERALRLVENRELIRVDIIPEAGLGTIWAGMVLDMNNWPSGTTNNFAFTREQEIFDDTHYINGIVNSHTFDSDSDGLLSQATGSAAEAGDQYEAVSNVLISFCEDQRQDCIYIADPLRYIFVQGYGDVKVLDDYSKNFSQHIYWPLKNLYGGANTSYACTYGNWVKQYDTASGKLVWNPSSGHVARKMIETDTNSFPWFAPAGLTRGVLNDVVDVGVNPTVKQRDLLYKSGINPIVYWPGSGYLVWGQKTLQKKPSAFDRVNVRRLFLWLEKGTLELMRFFVFEQNTVFTRNRVKSALAPIFDFAKNNEGVLDYMIVCDERNNSADVRDRNELVVDIYIKPVRSAEFILVNFIATRTSQSFSEII